MQRGNYQKKLEGMRAYYRTPAGRAAKQRAHAKRKEKLGAADKPLKINAKPLLNALANWKTS